MSCFSRTAAERGCARALLSGVLPRVRLLLAVASVAWLAACSGSTDVVGVLDPDVSDVARDPSSDPSSENPEGEAVVAPLTPGAGPGAEDSDVLLVAGLPLPEWDGPTSPWPLDTPLRSFFSDPSDVFSDSFPGPGEPWRDGAPEQAQREAFERMDVFSGEARRQLRFAASTGVAAERLRELFASVESSEDEPPSLVARDSWDDRYRVAVPAERCGRSGRRGGCSDAFSGGPGAFEPERRP